jgi:hypothetical protein
LNHVHDTEDYVSLERRLLNHAKVDKFGREVRSLGLTGVIVIVTTGWGIGVLAAKSSHRVFIDDHPWLVGHVPHVPLVSTDALPFLFAWCCAVALPCRYFAARLREWWANEVGWILDPRAPSWHISEIGLVIILAHLHATLVTVAYSGLSPRRAWMQTLLVGVSGMIVLVAGHMIVFVESGANARRSPKSVQRAKRRSRDMEGGQSRR